MPDCYFFKKMILKMILLCCIVFLLCVIIFNYLLFPSPDFSVRKILNWSSSGSGSGYLPAALLLRDSNVSRGSTANVFTIFPFRSTLMRGLVSLWALLPVLLGRKLLLGPTVGAVGSAVEGGPPAGDGRGLPIYIKKKKG